MIEQTIRDFDELADLVDPGQSGVDLYDGYLLSLIPTAATSVLEVGCGLGRLTRAIAAPRRTVVAVDLSPRMIARARQEGEPDGVSFVEGDFLAMEFSGRLFDCVISAAAMHHMPNDEALERMASLVGPGGRLIVHDLRRDDGLADIFRASVALSGVMLMRFLRTGRARQSKQVRDAWERHGAHERYLSMPEARDWAARRLPGSSVHYHWMWRYTMVWDREKLEVGSKK